MNGDARHLLELFDTLTAIDTHEHIGVEDGVCDDWRQTDRRRRGLWDIVFGAYLGGVFWCAGELEPPTLLYNDDEEEVWAWLKPRLAIVRNVGTYRAMMRGLDECYSFPERDLTEENWRPLSEKVRRCYESRTRMEWYAEAAAKTRVERMLRFVDTIYYSQYRPALDETEAEIERRLFGSISYVDFFLNLTGTESPHPPAVSALLVLLGLDFEFTWAFVRQAIETYFEFLAGDDGTVAVKFACAYWRSLEFREPDESSLERAWPERGTEADVSFRENFEACVMNEICRRAGEHGIPVIFHTGLGNDDVRAGHPVHLLPLIDRHPGTTFVLLHASFPYWQELAAIAGRRSNVMFDMSWSPLLSRNTFANLFSQAVELVQGTKFLIGHDVSTIEHMAGTHRITVEAITEVLAAKVQQGYYSPGAAEQMVRLLARENAERVFRLSS